MTTRAKRRTLTIPTTSRAFCETRNASFCSHVNWIRRDVSSLGSYTSTHHCFGFVKVICHTSSRMSRGGSGWINKSKRNNESGDGNAFMNGRGTWNQFKFTIHSISFPSPSQRAPRGDSIQITVKPQTIKHRHQRANHIFLPKSKESKWVSSSPHIANQCIQVRCDGIVSEGGTSK